MNYAIIANGGKQYKVSLDSILELDSIDAEPGTELILDKVLMSVDGDTIKLGTPYLENVSVTAEVLDHTKGEKIRVSQFKAKARHRRTIGFRAKLTKVKVTALSAKASKTAKA